MPDKDPFAELEQAAIRAEADKKAPRKVTAARIRQQHGRSPESAFFTVVGMNLEPVPCWDIETASTDGKRVLFNPATVMEWTDQEVHGVICGHEPLHVAFGHHARMQGKDHQIANIACDLSINQICRDAKYVLPSDALMPGKAPTGDNWPKWLVDVIKGFPEGQSVEWYYARIMEAKPPAGQDGMDDLPGDPGGCGGIIECEDQASAAEAAGKAECILASAVAAAKQRGELAGGLGLLVKDTMEHKIPWRDLLRDFITKRAKADYSWSKPNKRFLGSGLYLPSLYSEELGEILVAIDTSGSIGQDELDTFAGELEGVLECHPCHLTILHCDAEIQLVQEWSPDDGPLKLTPRGGGGTSHLPIVQWIKDNDAQPECVIALTDGYTCWPDDPGIPWMWGIVGNDSVQPPFGQVLYVKD